MLLLGWSVSSMRCAQDSEASTTGRPSIGPVRGSEGHTMDANKVCWALHGRLVENGDQCRISIETVPFQIGRRAGLCLTLRSGGVSGLHAEIAEREGGLWIRDLNSKNGTYVNGARILNETALRVNDIVQFADMPFRIMNDQPATVPTVACDQERTALALVQLSSLLQTQDILPVYQPVVDLISGEVVAFEALARSRLVGLETPAAMFNAASHLGVEADISRLMRVKAIQCSSTRGHQPHLFVNTHPAELAAPDLHERMVEMRSLAPFQRLTLEIHEAALTDVDMLIALQSVLKGLEIDLAFDDFGVGQARIAELAAISPQCVKFDRTLIANIDQATADRVRVVRCLVRALNEVQVTPLAEGVETEGEATTCRDLGFQLAQGYYFGRPSLMTTFVNDPIATPRPLSGLVRC
jgi:EAL domain-containing protein (putative c-di-GMP-specific phosphodiesterase class I)